MISPTVVAFFLLLTAIAYVIAYALYVRQTARDQQNFFHVAIFYLISGIFFLIYAIVNYIWVARAEKEKSTEVANCAWVSSISEPENIQLRYEMV